MCYRFKGKQKNQKLCSLRMWSGVFSFSRNARAFLTFEKIHSCSSVEAVHLSKILLS